MKRKLKMLMKRKLNIILTFLLVAITASAQHYTLTGEVEPVVHVGENFKLRYTLNTTDAEKFTLGKIPDAIDVLIGPSRSTSIRTVMVNGNTNTTHTLTLTYVLSANQTGKYTIPPASVNVSGQTIKSEPLTVQVIAANSNAGHQGNARTASANDFFVIVTASKKHVSEYEPFLLTYKVCWHPDLPVINLDPINLELQNVYMQPYNDVQQKSKKVETINGRVLVTVDWQQYVIYPQKSGRLQIPSMKMIGYLREDTDIDPFDPFSGGYREVAKQLIAPAVDIQVDALTDKPDGFSGGVGRFSISAQLDKSEVKENTPVTLAVKVSGRGNLNMLKEPIVLFPRGFDTYDTKQVEDFHITAEGLDGNVNYEFVAVPQRKGDYVIPPVRLTYYDVGSRSYQTAQTDSFRIRVLKGDQTVTSVQDFSQQGVEQAGDIRAIKTGPEQPAKGQALFGSSTYWYIVALIVLLFFAAFAFLRHRAQEQADAVKSRGRRANKVAVRRLRKAARLMHEGKAGEFYDETLRALWGYVGDKLNMSPSQLSRENISQRLEERGVDEQVTTSFIEAIDECEFVRYAPGDPQGNMNRVYDKSIKAIEQIESVKKHVRRSKALTMLAVYLCLLPSALSAQTKIQADEFYSQGDYEEAIAIYSQLVEKPSVSADVYYNMGNAYYRLDSIARAILCYERALRLQPTDDDIRLNLQLARSKTVDKIAPEREMFFVTWYRAFVRLVSVDAWAYIALVSIALAAILLLVFLFSYSERLRRLSFFASVTLIVVFLLANLFAWQQQQSLSSHSAAIVITDVLPVKNIPSDDGSDEFTIHAGTKATITDNTMTDWKQLRLPDGRQGWVVASAIEMI